MLTIFFFPSTSVLWCCCFRSGAFSFKFAVRILFGLNVCILYDSVFEVDVVCVCVSMRVRPSFHSKLYHLLEAKRIFKICVHIPHSMFNFKRIQFIFENVKYSFCSYSRWMLLFALFSVDLFSTFLILRTVCVCLSVCVCLCCSCHATAFQFKLMGKSI